MIFNINSNRVNLIRAIGIENDRSYYANIKNWSDFDDTAAANEYLVELLKDFLYIANCANEGCVFIEYIMADDGRHFFGNLQEVPYMSEADIANTIANIRAIDTELAWISARGNIFANFHFDIANDDKFFALSDDRTKLTLSE